MKRIKLAILCHFSSEEIRERLSLYTSCWYKYPDFAKWNSAIIGGVRDRDDIDLHVIAPHKGMKHINQEFECGGVNYHFFRSELPFPIDYLEHFLRPQSKHEYPRNRRYIKHFLSQIAPDVVVLIGAENAYYSVAALDVEGIPVMLHLQTVYANPDRLKITGQVDKQRWDTEVRLFKKIPYMACTGRMYYDLVKTYNPDAIIFPRCWPTSKFPVIPDVEKKYDFVYFARYLNKNKGFDNAIEAMGRFAYHHPDCKLLAVGTEDQEWPNYEARIKALNLENNLEIHSSFPEYSEMLKYVKQARFALLPITMDVLSGTILESMRMGMPVVTFRTSGTPSLNEKRETVLISDSGDWAGLYDNMERLYSDSNLESLLRKNAYLYIAEQDKKEAGNIERMVAQIKSVIAHYKDGTPIPNELLYNIEENKDYRKQ